jgi:hypothetical protein
MISASFLRPLALALSLASAAWGQPEAPKPAETPAPSPAPTVLPVLRIPDRGDFKVVYEKPKNPDYRELQQIFKQTRLLEETAGALDETIALPADIAVTLRECGAADAPWEADKRRVSICYELIDALADVFTAGAMSPEDLEQAGTAVAGATLFLFFHQAGHALIQLDALPIGSGEEEAADQLATLLLVRSGHGGENAAMNGASTFLARQEDAKDRAHLARLPFWSQHGFDERRLRNIICWVYGRNPKDFQDLVEDGTLPEERAGQCPAEYERMSQGWDGPLAPFTKGDAPSPPPPTP